MKCLQNKTAILTIIAAILALTPVLAYGYVLTAPLPGTTVGASTTFSEYLSALFRFAIVIASILAVIVIIIAGLKYIGAAGNPAVISDAKDQIYWAILGLILALSSYMILKIINPELVKLELEVEKTGSIQGSGGLLAGNFPGCTEDNKYCWMATESACTQFTGKKAADNNCTATKPGYATTCCETVATYVCAYINNVNKVAFTAPPFTEKTKCDKICESPQTVATYLLKDISMVKGVQGCE